MYKKQRELRLKDKEKKTGGKIYIYFLKRTENLNIEEKNNIYIITYFIGLKYFRK